jgi:hypothetical protein
MSSTASSSSSASSADSTSSSSSEGGYYSWSTFPVPDKPRKEWIKPGDPVSAADLDVDEDNWNELVTAGAVRKQEYPIPADSNFEGSPREYLLQQAQEVDPLDPLATYDKGWLDSPLQDQAQAAMDDPEGGWEAPAEEETEEAAPAAKTTTAPAPAASSGTASSSS